MLIGEWIEIRGHDLNFFVVAGERQREIGYLFFSFSFTFCLLNFFHSLIKALECENKDLFLKWPFLKEEAYVPRWNHYKLNLIKLQKDLTNMARFDTKGREPSLLLQ